MASKKAMNFEEISQGKKIGCGRRKISRRSLRKEGHFFAVIPKGRA
ncbi:MAG: hypothetical protein IJ027_07455 [Oscillospiraceae bacterium]|nr:hypothetical protein [Oscillospiraceae bacterium]